MFRNYLIVAVRNLMRNKVYSAINVLGLSIGMAGCILIVLFVQDELSYDRFHANADRIFRIGNLTPPAWAPTLKTDFPEVVETARVKAWTRDNMYVIDGRTRKQDTYFCYADQTIFKLFDLPLIDGDPETALTDPNSIVVTESIAKKYFGNTDPIGQTLQIDSGEEKAYQITGVLKDLPHNTHFRFHFLASLSGKYDDGDWHGYTLYTYALLAVDSDLEAFKNKLPDFVERHLGKRLANHIEMTPLTQLHFLSDTRFDPEGNGDMGYIHLLSAVAVLILVIACINFTNLSAARATRRAREVGLRKVVGACRSQMVRQFLGESLLMTFIALPLSVATVELILPTFNTSFAKQLALSYSNMPEVIIGLIGLAALVGLISGSYPAFVLSSFQPISALKGSPNGRGQNAFFGVVQMRVTKAKGHDRFLPIRRIHDHPTFFLQETTHVRYPFYRHA